MVIGVCGYGYTGSGALFSLLNEFDNIRCLPGRRDDFELDISYCPDGLEDLEYHLCNNPAKGYGSDSAIYRFELLINDYERSYNRFTNNRFRIISKAYLDDLIQIRWPAYRVFEYERQKSSVSRKIRLLKSVIKVQLKKKKIDKAVFSVKERYLSIEPEDFVLKTKRYVSDLIGDVSNEVPILLNQPFSVTNPLNGMRFFRNPYCIIVDRDPRDLYIMAKYVYGTASMFIPTDSVENFVLYYKKIRKSQKKLNSSRILKIRFEDLVFKYDDTVQNIIEFLDGKIGYQTKKKKKFRPEISAQNTCLFRNFSKDSISLKYIEKELEEFLYPFKSSINIRDFNELNKFTFL